MGLGKKAFAFFFTVVAVLGFCLGSVYKVGDSAGWTITGNVDYTKWASSKTFKIGDTLLFNYDVGFHNVLQVSLRDFHSCNLSSPLATYSTGNDSLTIMKPGHYYYICGIVGHCEAGQKVDIRVQKSLHPTATPIPSPTRAPPAHSAVPITAPPVQPIAPGPSLLNSANSLPPFKLICSKVALYLLVFGGVYGNGFV